MGTPDFAVPTMRALVESPKFEVVAAYTQPDKPVGRGLELRASPVKKLAVESGIPVFQPEKLSAPGELERLSALAPDVLVVVAYGQILRSNVLELPRLGCINIHSSLLPRWRGAAPIQWAILSGDVETGITTMKMAEKLDAGDILLQKKIPIGPRDTASTLHDRLAALGAELIGPTIEGLADGSLSGEKQDEARVTYAAKLTKEMEELKAATEPAAVLDRRIRALNPWPGTSVRVDGERLKIKEAVLRPDLSLKPGAIHEKAGMVLLATPQGALELTRLQWDGKKEVDPAGFLNGLRGGGLRERRKTLPLELS